MIEAILPGLAVLSPADAAMAVGVGLTLALATYGIGRLLRMLPPRWMKAAWHLLPMTAGAMFVYAGVHHQPMVLEGSYILISPTSGFLSGPGLIIGAVLLATSLWAFGHAARLWHARRL